MIVKNHLFVVIISIYVIFAGTLNLHAEPSSSFPEYQVKANYLCNFAKFVDWPEEAFKGADDPIIIAVLGKDPFDNYLKEAVKKVTIKGRNLMVKRFKTIDDLEQCHILFVSESKKNSSSDILYIIEGWPVLTVSNMEEFTMRGGIINFVTEENRISFEINADATDQAHIKISSKLLKLANDIKEVH